MVNFKMIQGQHFYRFVTCRSNGRPRILSLLLGAMLGTTSCDVVRLLNRADGSADVSTDALAADVGNPDAVMDSGDSGRDGRDAGDEAGSAANDAGVAPFVCPSGSSIRDTWKSLTESSSPWLRTWGDPAIVPDGEGSLRLSFDDVVVRGPLTGGYILRFQLAFSGDIFFLMQTNSGNNLTAISASSNQLYVTGGLYGGHEVPVGTFVGQPIGKTTARVAFFVKAGQRRAAMVAVGDSQTLGSGFLQLVGMVDQPHLIGANFGPSTGTVLVGPIDACQALSDTDVELAYQADLLPPAPL